MLLIPFRAWLVHDFDVLHPSLLCGILFYKYGEHLGCFSWLCSVRWRLGLCLEKAMLKLLVITYVLALYFLRFFHKLCLIFKLAPVLLRQPFRCSAPYSISLAGNEMSRQLRRPDDDALNESENNHLIIAHSGGGLWGGPNYSGYLSVIY